MRYFITFVIIFAVFMSNSLVAAPKAKTISFEQIKNFSTIKITNGDKPINTEIFFPAIQQKTNSRIILRFQARIDVSISTGSNNFLGIKVNGKQLDTFTANGTPRLLNRGAEMSFEEEGKTSGLLYWKKLQLDTDLMVIFGPGGEDIDPRIKSDRDEFYYYLVDITDLVNFSMNIADNNTTADVLNKITLSNDLLKEYVGGRQFDLIIEGLEVGYIPLKEAKSMWKGRVYEFEPITKPLAVLKSKGFNVLVGKGGTLQLDFGKYIYDITSSFSYPGKEIGYNEFSDKPGTTQDPQWKVSLKSKNKNSITLSAKSAFYNLERTVQIKNHKIEVSDKITNITKEPVGIIINNYASTSNTYTECLFGGYPEMVAKDRTENPTIFVKDVNGSLGVVVEDDVLRLQLCLISQPNRVLWKTDNFGLDAGKSYTVKWSLYPYDKNADYWQFINQVRRDWNVNYTITGQWDFFHLYDQANLINNPDKLNKMVKDKNLRYVSFSPWLDYDNLNIHTGELVGRDEYKKLVKNAAEKFRKANPTIKLLGNIESFPFQLSVKDSAKLFSMIPPEQRIHFSFPLLNKETLLSLDGVDENLLKSLTQLSGGKYTAELYYRWLAGTDGRQDKNRSVPMAALSAYPAPGNAMQKHLLDQARFLIEDCKLDGLYIDCFTMAFSGFIPRQRYDYKAWDGHTVDINPSNGQIIVKYTDAGLVGGDARVELINYVLKKGKTFIAHSFPVCRAEQTLPVMWFAESEWNFEAPKIGKGEKPPFFYRMCGSHLSTPLSLTSEPSRWKEEGDKEYSKIIMKSLITYLRHGALSYYYSTIIPESNGSYGPYAHMFPFTPIELHEGWIIGKERTITAISGTYQWNNKREPNVLVFDINGRPIEPNIETKRNSAGWIVRISLEDWENVAVVN